MEKALIIGCPGAGKSRFARALHQVSGLPLYHLDLIWHLPDRTHLSRQAFDESWGRFYKRNSGSSTGTTCAPLSVGWPPVIPSFCWIFPSSSALQVRHPASAKSGRTCRGWRPSLMRSFAGGSWILNKIRCPRSAGCSSVTAPVAGLLYVYLLDGGFFKKLPRRGWEKLEKSACCPNQMTQTGDAEGRSKKGAQRGRSSPCAVPFLFFGGGTQWLQRR